MSTAFGSERTIDFPLELDCPASHLKMRKNLAKLCDIAILRQLIHDASTEVGLYDKKLLALNASERCITHRFAIYLEDYLYKHTAGKVYQVDCEYNRIGVNVKRLSKKHLRYALEVEDRNHDAAGNPILIPDVIVHRRGRHGPNLMALELKTTANLDKVIHHKGERVSTERDYAIDRMRGYIERKNCTMPMRHWYVFRCGAAISLRKWSTLFVRRLSTQMRFG